MNSTIPAKCQDQEATRRTVSSKLMDLSLASEQAIEMILQLQGKELQDLEIIIYLAALTHQTLKGLVCHSDRSYMETI